MFTGLIEEIGQIKNIITTSNIKKITVKCSKVLDELKLGDSVAINGVCQTVTKINDDSFSFDTITETLSKTTFNSLRYGDNVNLERALTLTSRLDGHIVQGHIDTRGKIIQINKLEKKVEFYVAFPQEFKHFLAHTGSICIDGISLTVADIFDYSFKVAIIPTTLENTIAKNYKIGSEVNLEFDIIGKYIYSILSKNTSSNLSNFISQPDF